ncbi:concanavalin A-like lectin/glucanase domain-containing protein [Talaromyces proteolyticus]|uniref:xyloglucan-specific endo-beta-1,4-glucanase n=1 Tax=Talaromyces proteolyticus TaxID=1131652 RepID=A0AAD4KIT8_9EURO|nr:concanavalin A-like lectin/glucanase domain-containing protein [Talaromyces proteolyticus]KAH8693555.1 concanavalin A-like lectin/glucanase domain-containing protein [Talaromyces proteolyticus]
MGYRWGYHKWCLSIMYECTSAISPPVVNPATANADHDVQVTTFDNGTYATNTTAPEFAVTWNYTQGNPDQPVHAFPNIMINGTTLPVHVNSLNNITLDVDWTYGLGNEPVATTDIKSLDTASLNANVAVDMFLDSTQELSSDSEKAKYEIMVWLARFGTSTYPYGKQTSITQTVNGVNSDLWSGTKTTTNQIVLTWVVPDGTTAQNFTGDLRTLLDRPTGIAEGEYPSATDYLGHFSFGSEAYYIDTNVTFHVPNFAIDIRT